MNRTSIGAETLLSSRRFVAVYCLAFVITLADLLFVQFLGISTPSELLLETLVHGTGFYLGYTLVAVFNRPRGIV